MYPNQPDLVVGVATPARGGRMPSKDTLDYIKVGIEVLLLLLAIPWLVKELTRNPGRVSKRAAGKHLAGS